MFISPLVSSFIKYNTSRLVLSYVSPVSFFLCVYHLLFRLLLCSTSRLYYGLYLSPCPFLCFSCLVLSGIVHPAFRLVFTHPTFRLVLTHPTSRPFLRYAPRLSSRLVAFLTVPVPFFLVSKLSVFIPRFYNASCCRSTLIQVLCLRSSGATLAASSSSAQRSRSGWMN